jgi:UDP-GlcNAc3NAcA epimerase
MARIKPLIISLVGARPQFVKLAPLSRSLARLFGHVIVHSGQHYDRVLSDVFFDQLHIPPADYNLRVGSGEHAEMTGKIMIRFEKLLLKLKPSLVLVYGDTNSTIAGALAAAKLRIPVGHIEAGMRSYRPEMPEELNRVVTDHLSTLLFCPTSRAILNLKCEGIKKGVIRSGDLMYELLDSYKRKVVANKRPLRQLGVNPGEYYYLTLHRAGNVDNRERLTGIVDVISRLKVPIVFPVHPRTGKNMSQFGLLKKLESFVHVALIEPQMYLDGLTLIYNAAAVLTDSGGIQKESVFLKTPCLTLRDETEWPETLTRGNFLVGISWRRMQSILKAATPPLRGVSYKIGGRKPSEIIASALLKFFRK